MFDRDKIVKAVVLFLESIGEDTSREGLDRTSTRVAAMCEELSKKSYQATEDIFDTSFFVENYNDLVVIKDIPFVSFCEHHIMPFVGHASICYLPKNGRVVGISKFARLVNKFSSKLQIQERMTVEIAKAIMSSEDIAGTIVIITAEHMCMNMRGAKAEHAKTITRCCMGELSIDKILRSEALSMLSSS